MAESDVSAAAEGLILAAMAALGEQGLFPRRRRHSWIEVGRDYAGATLAALPEFDRFERAVREAYPGRFEAQLRDREYAQQYAFPLVEGAIARMADLGDNFDATTAVSTAIEELRRLLERDRDDVVVAQVVSDVNVETPLMIGDVEVRPIGDWGLRGAFKAIDELLPGTGKTLESEVPVAPFTFQFAILLVRRAAPVGTPLAPGYYTAAMDASNAISSTLTSIRLTTAATASTIVEAIGPPGYVRLRRPRVVRHEYNQLPLIQRIGQLTPQLAPAIDTLQRRLTGWRGDERAPNTVTVALSRYARSFLDRPWFDLVVDIGIGLEAALLGGGDHEEISLRLRSRAATLLATTEDPAKRIYQDVKRLYNLRSDVVHGSNPPQRKIDNELKYISTTARSSEAGVKGALALDRGRDILRRAVLARALLIEAGKLPEAGRWPDGSKADGFDLDEALIEPTAQEEWRQAWRDGRNTVGLDLAANVAPEADLHVALPTRARHGSDPEHATGLPPDPADPQ